MKLMGIVNVTPDSFSDGGELPNLEARNAAARHRTDVHESLRGLVAAGSTLRRPAG